MTGGLPMGIDVGDGLQSTFGCVEFEKAAVLILHFLADPFRKAEIHKWQGEVGEGWGKKFYMDTIDGISPTMFAALCAAGWISHTWFPKGSFCVSKAFVERVERRDGVGRTA